MPELKEILEELSFVPGLTTRAMFGGITLYSEGRVFAIVVDRELYLKADDLSEPVYQAAGSEPFTYFKDHRPYSMRYWKFPQEEWPKFVQIALETAHRAPVRKRKPRGNPNS